eukprot:TRINITY_DN87438_c0_g1_i1.p1 TRINITY_DN87438_c0_g1~~TRINITY_DN87438_c0_g1_i1.p1  ORF type:complete len:246 (+),score=37.15 TRINITY_DN87438_c0_g1_i1:47-739(+)
MALSGHLETLLHRCSSAQVRSLQTACPRFHVMKDSWPKLQTPNDPSRPSVSRVMKSMIENKSEMAKGNRGADRQTSDIPDKRRFNRHLPDSYFPRASAPPIGINKSSAAMEAARATSMPSMGVGGGPQVSSQWRPPGWKQGSRLGGLAEKAQPKAKPGEKMLPFAEIQERPVFEVWGMRVVAALLVVALYMELRDVSIGPDGMPTRKVKPKRHLTPQEEEEQRRLQAEKS